MSLQLWLPLNGNLENLGLSDLSFKVVNYSNAVSSATSGGKVVSGLYKRTTKETADYIISDKNITLDGDVTMCCWAKVTGIGYSGTANGLFGQHGHLTGGLGITMKDVSSTDLRMSINTGLYGDSHGGASDRTYCTYYGSTNIYNAWHHLCLTYESKTRQLRMYVDGKLENIEGYGSYITLNGNNTTPRPVILFAWSTDHLGSSIVNYRPPCELNDVRIYDHVLSAKEVHEVAKGLVAHYQLKGMGRTNYMKGTSKYTKDNPLIRNATDSSVLNDSYTYYDLSDLSITVPSEGTYTLVLEADNVLPSSHSTSSSSASERRLGIFLQNTSTSSHYFWSNYGTGSTGEVYGSFDLPAGTYKFRTNLYANDKVNYQVKMWNMKFVQGGYDPDDIWCPNSEDTLYHILGLNSGIETDCSGYGNDGTKNADFRITNGSARYGSCYMFSGADQVESYLDTTGWTDATVAAWVKPSTFAAGSDDRSCVIIGGFYLTITTAGQVATYCYGKSNAGYHTSSTVLPLNAWTHIAATWNETTKEHKLYINGKCEYTIADCSGVMSSDWHRRKYIGRELWWAENHDNTWHRPFTGSISDARIYCTALSASDIADLYSSAASVSKDGTLFGYDFRENKRNIVDKDGTVAYEGFNDRVCPIYDMSTKVLADGSTWARIHHLDLTSDKIFFANASEVAKCSKHNRFSRMGVVDKFKSQPSLSSGYTELEYIQSSGTQYIDTGIAPTNDMRVEISYIPTDRMTEHSIFGSSWAVNGFFLMIYQGNFRFHTGGSVIDAISCSAGTRYIMECTTNHIKINGTTYDVSGVGNTTNNILLLGDMGYNESCRGIGKIEYTKIWANDTLVRNFVPCKNLSGTVGLYDLVEKKFYGNSGSGAFTAGDYVSKYEFMLTYGNQCDDDEYTQLDYIESTGTQYIDTGVACPTSQTFKLKMQYAFNTTEPANQIMGFTGNRGMGIGTSGATWWECSSPASVDVGTYYTVEWTKSPNGNWTRVINGNVNSGGESSAVYTGNLYLFAAHETYTNPTFTPTYYCHCKLYNAQVYIDNQLVRDFIPCVNIHDEVGLYDKVTKRFFTNGGSGKFVAGPAGYNRWTQTSSPSATSVTGYTPINIAWPAHSAGIRKHGSACIYNCDSGDTWYAPIGQTAIWEGGIPAANGNMQLQTELWVRTDKSAEATQTKIYDGAIVASEFIEL